MSSVKVKVSELSGKALDYAVAVCEGRTLVCDFQYTEETRFDGWWQLGPKHWQPLAKYSQDMAIAGPIIDREITNGSLVIKNETFVTDKSPRFSAEYRGNSWEQCRKHYGPSVLIAAMRCYVASKMGEKVEIPQELL